MPSPLLSRYVVFAATLVVLLTVTASALGRVRLDTIGAEYSLSSDLEILTDASRTLDIHSVRSLEYRDRFHRNGVRVPSFGYTDSAFWVRFHLANPTDTLVEKVLELAHPTVNELDLYIDDGSGALRHVASGMARPFAARGYDYHNFLFDLDIRAHQDVTVYLRYFTLSSSLIPLVLWDQSALVSHITRSQYVHGMVAGAFLLLIFYNGILYFPLKNRAYLYFILFLTSALLYELSVRGFAYQMLWPDRYAWGDRSLPFFVFTTFASGGLFSVEVLELKKTAPSMARAFLLAVVTCSIGAVSVFLMDYARVVYLSTIAAGGCTIFVLGAAVYLQVKRIPRAGEYLIGLLFLAVGALLAVLKFLGILPAIFITDYGLQIGFVCEMSLFSVVLGKRINALMGEVIAEEHRRIAGEERNALLTKTNRIIRDAYDQIESSLDYAMRTQKALVPRHRNPVLSATAPLLLWRCRDKVGGDLPILEETSRGVYFGVVDCTGHGVPGALLTMTVSSCLKRIIHDEDIETPGEVLKRINVMLKNSLNKDRVNTENDDGLDMALCYRRKGENEVLFAGARLPLYSAAHPNALLTEINPSRQSLGYLHCDDAFDYQTHVLPIVAKMRLFMWTDGYIDQLGGEKTLPYGKTRLVSLLSGNADKELASLESILLESFKQWRGDNPVQDDITILGVEF